MGTCDGPRTPVFPAATCGSPSLPSMNIMDIINAVPGQIHGLIQDAARTNAFLGRVLAYNGIDGLEVEADSALVQGFRLSFDTADAVWLVGCWPPQRYVVVDGVVRMPSGRMVIRTAGVSLVVSAYDLSLRFERLRADIACHAGYYTLVSITQGVESRTTTADALVAAGEINIRCEAGWTVLCLLLGVGYRWLSLEAVARLPQLVAYLLTWIEDLELGPGCDNSMHNTVTLLPYASQECCEQSFALDPYGCLVGGQFNGRVPGSRKVMNNVSCEAGKTVAGTHTARCETIPGYYAEYSPGVCREGPLPPWHPKTVNPDWDSVHWALRALGWADLLITVAVWWTCATCCCCFACLRPAPLRMERRKHRARPLP
mmetsp:Transcript_48672/g.147557  ORF Transcript_48672/g.147557 Transcript_48672/m.147557 type:complete len:372 (-) Transcript_48672:142-1257(-)